ncbi:MAG: Smr/MutS family protein, partial [Victivallales bacterium]|nr:Smr/MutS family protein [Victivallales bacterium]
LIARRLGMPAEVLKSAQAMMSGDQLHLEEMITRMEADQKRLAGHASRMADAEAEMNEKRETLRNELEELRQRRRQLLLEAHRQADALVANTRREMENLIRSIREQAKGQGGAVKVDAEAARAALAEKTRKLQEGTRMHATHPKAPVKPAELQVGHRVWVAKLNAHGTVQSLDDGGKRATIAVNGIPFTLQVSELEAPKDGKTVEVNPPVFKISTPSNLGRASYELNLIGLRVEEALSELASFIDRATLGHLPEVRIVHGFGTGRLRDAVQDWLQHCPAVRSYHIGRDGKDPGAGGCTIVTLT